MAKATVRPHAAKMTLDLLNEYTDQLFALAAVIEERLGAECNDGEDPPDNAPLTTWRVSQVLKEMLGSAETIDTIRSILCEEPSHV